MSGPPPAGKWPATPSPGSGRGLAKHLQIISATIVDTESQHTLRDLYPALQPYMDTRLAVGGGHQIYLEQVGNPEGIPVLLLHGGPGSGCDEQHRCYFDPARYRVILFDQRGSHRSTPAGGLEHNTTPELLRDMEALRAQLNVDQWVLYGGSWGATLALLYAEAHPERVSGIILRGAFLAREEDLRWFVGQGVQRIFPDQWQRFLAFFGPEVIGGEAMAQSLYQSLTSDDLTAKEKAARAWAQWAGSVVTASLGIDYKVDEAGLARHIIGARIEMHYAVHRYFIAENQILNEVGRLPNVPIHIIHGRLDLTCLPEASWLLHRALPGSTLQFVNGAGHLASEPRMRDALVCATDAMAGRLEPG